jgi:hypothetical protein
VKDRLRSILGNEQSPGSDLRQRPHATSSVIPVADNTAPGPPQRRQSPGLEQFVSTIKDQENLSILDLSSANQANISFITGMGHRPFADDIVHALDSAFGDGDFLANQADPERIHQFMAQALDFAEDTFGGALVWDSLQFLAPPLLQDTVDQLYRVLTPGASLLAFFNADEKQLSLPSYSYRIVDAKTLILTPKVARRRAQFFNNRSIEKLFSKFRTVKFFLTRDHLREVIVTR